jgi:6-pyruvoyl tetrahydropterin synthase/QueD family protein
MGGEFSVRVDGIRFASAHMATFGGKCEPLHGHSYQVEAEVEGRLTDDSWVVDFQELKALLRHDCAELDHKFILQCESRLLQLAKSNGAWTVSTPQGRSYQFPLEDVAALPIDNSTAERLAEWLCRRLWSNLHKAESRGIRAVIVDVWEGPGQKASFRLSEQDQ